MSGLALVEASLPNLGAESIEDQARSVLRLVLRPVPAAVVPSNASLCPNCDAPCVSTRSPYCSEACREAAGFVRQFRAGVALGWIMVEQKQVALGQVLWHVLGGGRPLRTHIAPRRSIEKAHARAHGICEACGATATTVDHLGSGCNRDINLRAVCGACCGDKPFGDLSVLASPILDGLAARVTADEPLRCCDDAETWDWWAYLALRMELGAR